MGLIAATNYNSEDSLNKALWDVSGEELLEKPVILLVIALIGRWVLLEHESGAVLTM